MSFIMRLKILSLVQVIAWFVLYTVSRQQQPSDYLFIPLMPILIILWLAILLFIQLSPESGDRWIILICLGSLVAGLLFGKQLGLGNEMLRTLVITNTGSLLVTMMVYLGLKQRYPIRKSKIFN